MNVIWRCEPPPYNRVSRQTLRYRDDKQETGICGLAVNIVCIHCDHERLSVPLVGCGTTPTVAWTRLDGE